jgi:hypothetical protein
MRNIKEVLVGIFGLVVLIGLAILVCPSKEERMVDNYSLEIRDLQNSQESGLFNNSDRIEYLKVKRQLVLDQIELQKDYIELNSREALERRIAEAKEIIAFNEK